MINSLIQNTPRLLSLVEKFNSQKPEVEELKENNSQETNLANDTLQAQMPEVVDSADLIEEEQTQGIEIEVFQDTAPIQTPVSDAKVEEKKQVKKQISQISSVFTKNSNFAAIKTNIEKSNSQKELDELYATIDEVMKSDRESIRKYASSTKKYLDTIAKAKAQQEQKAKEKEDKQEQNSQESKTK